MLDTYHILTIDLNLLDSQGHAHGDKIDRTTSVMGNLAPNNNINIS